MKKGKMFWLLTLPLHIFLFWNSEELNKLRHGFGIFLFMNLMICNHWLGLSWNSKIMHCGIHALIRLMLTKSCMLQCPFYRYLGRFEIWMYNKDRTRNVNGMCQSPSTKYCWSEAWLALSMELLIDCLQQHTILFAGMLAQTELLPWCAFCLYWKICLYYMFGRIITLQFGLE